MRHFFVLLPILTLFLSCNRIRKNAERFGDSTKLKSGKIFKKAIGNLLPVGGPDSASIKNFVPAFQQNRSIQQINGVQLNISMFYVNFFVYKASRNVVLKGVSSIVPEKTFDIKSDSICTPISDSEVLLMGVPSAHNEHTQFFWHFRQLKKINAFRCVKGLWQHYIIFDSNSDTVYHEIEELRD